jgi:hypothetical protein
VAPSAWRACVEVARGVGSLSYADTWRDAFGALTGVLEFTHTARLSRIAVAARLPLQLTPPSFARIGCWR